MSATASSLGGRETQMSYLKTAILLAGLTGLFMGVGYLIGGAGGAVIALVIAAATNLFAYWNSDRMVLSMYGAHEVDRPTALDLVQLVADLAGRAGLPMPRVFLIDEAQPNAFATGRNPEHAAVAARTGILQILSARELRGVMAHELAHVKHRDILTSTIAATMAGAISALAHMGFLFGGRGDDRPNPVVAMIVMILAPIAAMLIQFAISRAREFGADSGGAEISGDPQALASALEKMERYARGLPLAAAEQHPETAQMMIINPLTAEGITRL